MERLNTDAISVYYGGVIAFTKTTEVSNSSGMTQVYQKGHEAHITPSILHMIGARLVPTENVKLVLRELHQLEDSELIDLADIVAPRSDYEDKPIRVVVRSGEGRQLTIEINLGSIRDSNFRLTINADYDIALTQITNNTFGMPPIINQLAIKNQRIAHRWMLQKHLDVFNYISRGLAAGRRKWNSKGYETPGTLKRYYEND